MSFSQVSQLSSTHCFTSGYIDFHLIFELVKTAFALIASSLLLQNCSITAMSEVIREKGWDDR